MMIDNHETSIQTYSEVAHNSPHVLPLRAEGLFGTEIITSTIFSTWLFIIVLFLWLLPFFFSRNKKKGFLFMTGFIIVRKINTFISEIIKNKKFAQKILPLLGGTLLFIFLANIFWLFLEGITFMFTHTSTEEYLHTYLRSINTDINTTAAMAISIIFISHIVMFSYRGLIKYITHYAFHFHGENIIEKIINIPVGWLHALGEFIRITSLSMRLFGNIFGGTILLTVIAYLTSKIGTTALPIGQIFMVPFWLFETLVAFIQALIFTTLACVYFDEATSSEH